MTTAADRLKTILSTEEGAQRLEKLLATPALPPTPIETAIVIAGEVSATAAGVKVEQLKSQLDLAKRRIAELETILLGKENVIKNLEEQQNVRGVEVIARAALLLERADQEIGSSGHAGWCKERDALRGEACASRAVAWEIDLQRAKQ